MANIIEKKENNQLIIESEVEYKLNILVKGQTTHSKQLKSIQNDLQKGFIGLALRNEQRLRSNKELKQEFDVIFQELKTLKQEREEKAARKKNRANRKRLPKRDPMTGDIYKKLIQTAEGPTYLKLRLRLALCLLAVTGVHINELLFLRVNQLETLFKEN